MNFLKKDYHAVPFSQTSASRRKSSKYFSRRKKTVSGRERKQEIDTGWYDYVLGLRLNTHRFDSKYHHCRLIGHPRDVLTRFINYGIFVNWRRTIKQSMMISPKHPYTRRYASSSCRLEQEENRHLVWFHRAIHPFSMFTFHYEAFFMLVVMWQVIIYPVFLLVYRNQNRNMYWNALPISVAYVVTIILSFFTGYYDSYRNIVILSQRHISMHYLKSYFIFDVLALVPQLLRGYLVGKMGLIWNIENQLWVKIVGPLLFSCHYARYFWCLRVLLQVRLYYGMSTYVYNAVKLIFNSLMVLILCTYVSRTVMGMEIWHKFYSVENNQLSLYNATAAFMRYRALPVSLRNRIYLYMDFKYQGNFYKDSVIKKIISSALRQEILFTVSETGMKKVQLFQKCPAQALERIRNSLYTQIYLPGDIIIKEGTEGNCMYFILAGTVAVTSASNKPLTYLRDGAHFGEISLVINIPRVANVVAITPCELFRLDKTPFNNVMRLYPKIMREIRKDANDRLAKTSESLLDVDRLFKTTVKHKRVFYCFNE